MVRTTKPLAEKRPFLLASIVAALAFYYLRSGPWPEAWFIPLKGAAVVLLAVYARLRHGGADARLLAVLLLIAAGAEMALEVDGLAAHVLWFAFHAVALMLWLRHRRILVGRQDKVVAVLLLLAPSAMLAWLVGEEWGGIVSAAYGLALGGMAAGAWTSTFPRARVAAGAMLIAVGDLLWFAGTGPLLGSQVPQIFGWPLTYLGQLLIALGVVGTLRKREPELRLVRSR
ncbi:lysoplasmalogenase [Croceibacterium sp. TMG7-5b_MA50]|uniref:lysoplasmalogenase n=1 Tax=Croceibacterium sp. TMG7-5b_MA50 TaxID=3121290 RepID=UPI00322194EF